MPNYRIFKSTTSAPDLGLAVTGTNAYYSKKVSARDGQPISLHLVWAGTVTGAFTLWYSNLENPGVDDDTDWVQDTTFPAPTVSNSGKSFHALGNLTATHVRLKYVNATGSATIQGYACIAAD